MSGRMAIDEILDRLDLANGVQKDRDPERHAVSIVNAAFAKLEDTAFKFPAEIPVRRVEPAGENNS